MVVDAVAAGAIGAHRDRLSGMLIGRALGTPPGRHGPHGYRISRPVASLDRLAAGALAADQPRPLPVMDSNHSFGVQSAASCRWTNGDQH